MGMSIRNGGAGPRKQGLLAALPTCPMSGVFCKLHRPIVVSLGKTWVPWYFLNWKLPLKKVYCCKVKSSLPRGRENKQKSYSGFKCMKDLVISSLLCYPSPGLRRFMNERFVGICLGKTHTTGSVPGGPRGLPSDWKCQFLRREHGWIITESAGSSFLKCEKAGE